MRDHVVIGWAANPNGTATGRASVQNDRWNYTVSLDNPEKQEELFDLISDPEEKVNVIADYLGVVSEQRKRLEVVIQQQLPAVFLEVCAHPVLGPGEQYARVKGNK